MSSTNTPAAFWNVGDSVARDYAGGTVALPTPFVVSTATDAPTDEPTGSPFYLAVDDAYVWDGAQWVGPYSVAT
jgi:hypothetical protein